MRQNNQDGSNGEASARIAVAKLAKFYAAGGPITPRRIEMKAVDLKGEGILPRLP